MTATDYDVIAAEVHRKAIENVTNEMAISLVRTSGSPVVIDAKDFSTCLMDKSAEHLYFAAYVLFHFASSRLGTQAIIDLVAHSGDELKPGDGWIVNDPHEGGAIHQGDVGVIMPMFHKGEHMGWGFVNMQVLDIGGVGMGGIAPAAHDVFGEALRFTPIKAIRNGEIDPEWENFIAANVRAPAPVLNDIRSMIAANNVGNRKLSAVIDSFGRERYEEFCELNNDISERVLRDRISRLPDGVYEAIEWVEYDGHGGPDRLLEITLKMEVTGSDLKFTYTGAPQIDAFVNAGAGAMWGQTVTAVLTTLAYGDLPINGGVWRPIQVELGDPGTIINPNALAAVSNGHVETGMRACKLARDTLSQAMSLSGDAELLTRVGAKANDGPVVTGLFGGNQHGGVSVVFYLDSTAGIGGGAQTIGDGQDAYGCTTMTGCGIADVEAHEAADPLDFVWRKLVVNSGGPGQFRGGQGMDQAFALAFDHMAGSTAFAACAELPASGFGGGFPGSGGGMYVIRTSNLQSLHSSGRLPTQDRLEGLREDLANNVDYLELHRDDVLVMFGGGGGGLGDPLLREVGLVVADVRDSYLTAEHAAAAYGVVLSESGELDEKATAEQRQSILAARIGGTPSKPLQAPKDIGVSVVHLDSAWHCGSCNEKLAPAQSNWRGGAVVREVGIVERFAELRMEVRARSEDPSVVVRESYCPSCAHCLGVDVLAAGSESPGAPKLSTAGSERE